ncbi:hypothetical protein CGLAU_00095 [Corynebacterium glaucum]|uniref:DoxX n=1 Tax=Corynebacterium glaucum TaxID=187491 RepID=A0A1Q2HT58_9CORY|nr:hypothetical protein [Corynebacterium glaucum]AQQ14025.1 hypothetical protein CGLAU_00095 [Corynebacterium glaucum]
MFNPLNLLPVSIFSKQDKTNLGFASATLRAPLGLYILNSGLGKFGADKETAEGLQDMAATGIPALDEFDPETFAKTLAASETALAAALLLPFVPNRLAGLGLATFGAGLLTMYFGNDQMTEDDGIRPSHDGLSLSKDAWLVAIGAALMALPRK